MESQPAESKGQPARFMAFLNPYLPASLFSAGDAWSFMLPAGGRQVTSLKARPVLQHTGTIVSAVIGGHGTGAT